MEIKEIVEDIVAKRKQDGGIKNVFLVGCGGSYGALFPANKFLETEALEIRSFLISSNEFVHQTPASFGKNSMLIVSCHKGNTPETIEAAKLAHARGVPVVLLTWFEESEIIQYVDYVIRYSFGTEKDIGREKTIMAVLVVTEILNQTEGYANYTEFIGGIGKINAIVKKACKKVEYRASMFAKKHKDDQVIFTMGSGASYGAAYMESICILMEMQWIPSPTIHSGEFFHGPLEVVDKNVPFMIQVSEGRTRVLDERALDFLKKYSDRITVLDAKELGLSAIDNSVVDYFNHSLFNNIYNVYNQALAIERQHPLTTRRYMWKVPY
ncbi:MAG: SIS domain-containing protein [Sphaerochaeta sp.]|jgi:fructoselysine-6-P-deglycase FrlB-like protein